MKKFREKLDLLKLNFQVIRRTIATLGQEKGTPKDIQDCCGTRGWQRRPMSACRRFRKA